MLDAAGLERAVKIGLVHDALDIAIARVRAPPDLPAGLPSQVKRIAEHVALLVVGLGVDIGLVIMAEACGVADLHASEIMLEPHRGLIGVAVPEIAILEAIKGAARDMAGDAARSRDRADRRLGKREAGG